LALKNPVSTCTDTLLVRTFNLGQLLYGYFILLLYAVSKRMDWRHVTATPFGSTL